MNGDPGAAGPSFSGISRQNLEDRLTGGKDAVANGRCFRFVHIFLAHGADER
jgi:hypothetical protein